MEPRASRPTKPDGYWRSRPLPWRWARERLTHAQHYWIASTLADGRPHSRPVDGVWIDDSFYFDTGSRIGVNVMANPEIIVHLGDAEEVVIVEGVASRLTDGPEVARFLEAYNPKYNTNFSGPPGALFLVRPRVAFGWLCDATNLDEGAIFGSTGTRWDFDDAE